MIDGCILFSELLPGDRFDSTKFTSVGSNRYLKLRATYKIGLGPSANAVEMKTGELVFFQDKDGVSQIQHPWEIG